MTPKMTIDEVHKRAIAERESNQLKRADKPRKLEIFCPVCGKLTGDIQRMVLPAKYKRPDIVTVTFLEYGSECVLCKGASIGVDEDGNLSAEHIARFHGTVAFDSKTGKPL